MSSSRFRHLPAPLRAWGVVGRSAAAETQLTVAGRLAKRLLARDRTYMGAEGFAMCVDPEDPFQAAMACGLFGRPALALMRQFIRPGGTTIDAGAHLGYFTLRMARLVGPAGSVHAFEPDPRLYPRLREHCAVNAVVGVTANECGLLDRHVEAQILQLSPQLGWSSVALDPSDAADTASVRMTTLDSYVEDHAIAPKDVCFVKVDVEGAELDALRGAERTLSETSAAVLVEHIRAREQRVGHELDAVPDLMRRLGFTPHVPAVGRTGPKLVQGVVPPVGQDVLFIKDAP